MRRLYAGAAVLATALSGSGASGMEFSGTYVSQALTVEIVRQGTTYAGFLVMGGGRIPLVAAESAGTLTGRFTHEGDAYSFTARLSGSLLTLESDGTTYVLEKQGAATPSRPPAAAPPSKQGRAVPAPKGAQGSMFFTRVAIRDPAVNNEEALVFLMPKGWKVEGGIVWMHNFATLANALVRVSDPQTSAAVEWLPYQQFVFIPNPPMPMQPWQNYMGQLVLQPIADGPAFAQAFWMSNALSHLRDARLVKQEDLPKLAAEFVRQFGGPAQAKGFRLRYEYDLNGRPWEEEVVFALLFSGGPEIQSWYVNFATTRRAPKGMLDTLNRQMTAILSSAYHTPRWLASLQVCRQLFTQGIRQQLEDTRVFGQKLQEHREYITNLSQKLHEERMESSGRQAEATRELLGGVETYQDAYKGESIQLPASYKEYWANAAGEYILSEQAGYDPNVGAQVEWKKMERRDPMQRGR